MRSVFGSCRTCERISTPERQSPSVDAHDIFLAVPNISEGRDAAKIATITGTHALLDISSDSDHERSILTKGGLPRDVFHAVIAMVERAVELLDIREHVGVHPRFGVVDVLPFVPYGVDEDVAHRAVGEVVERITASSGVPFHFYDRASPDGITLPELRRKLRKGGYPVHPTAGVICIGIRDPLVAFNVNVRASLDAAKRAAAAVRSPSIRALGFELPSRGLVQVSMNLIAPLVTGPREAFERVQHEIKDIVDCEVVGLVPEPVLEELEGLPLGRPVRSIEQALRGRRDRDPLQHELDE